MEVWLVRCCTHLSSTSGSAVHTSAFFCSSTAAHHRVLTVAPRAARQGLAVCRPVDEPASAHGQLTVRPAPPRPPAPPWQTAVAITGLLSVSVSLFCFVNTFIYVIFLEKEMATHSSIFAWKIPQTEESDRLQSTGSQKSDTTERLHHPHRVVS